MAYLKSPHKARRKLEKKFLRCLGPLCVDKDKYIWTTKEKRLCRQCTNHIENTRLKDGRCMR